MSFSFIGDIARADEFRYWYNTTCEQRWLASLRKRRANDFVLQGEDGKLRSLPYSECAPSELIFSGALADCMAAADELSIASWLPTYETEKLHQLLGDNHVTPENLSTGVLTSWYKPRSGLRRLEDLTNRWVEISGIQYPLIGHSYGDRTTGFAQIRVAANGNVVVDPRTVAKVRLLPSSWRGQKTRYVAYSVDGPKPSWERGPPINFAMLYNEPEIWKYELVFDSVDQVWTDLHIARSHELIADSEKQFKDWQAAHRVSTGTWNYHRANDIASQEYLADWIGQFPWCSRIPGENENLSQADYHYTIAAELVPQWRELILRRAAVREGLGRYQLAVDDLDFFDKLPVVPLQLPISVREDTQNNRDAIVVRARVYSRMGQHHPAIQTAKRLFDTDVEDGRCADLAITIVGEANAPRSPIWEVDKDALEWTSDDAALELCVADAVELLKLVGSQFAVSHKSGVGARMREVHSSAAEHFKKRRAQFFSKARLGPALTAGAVASSYSVPNPEAVAREISLDTGSAMGEFERSLKDVEKERKDRRYRKSLASGDHAYRLAKRLEEAGDAEAVGRAEGELVATVGQYLAFTFGYGL